MNTRIALLLGLALLGAPGAEAQFTYTTNNGAITLAQYSGSAGVVVISNFVNCIGTNVFANSGTLTSITIPNNVTNIERGAFQGCTKLTNATIPNSVISLGNSVFEDCAGLTTLTIPNSVTDLGGFAFEGCSGLTNVTIGSGITSIGQSAFAGCRMLANVRIPNSVGSIGCDSFMSCSGLRSIVIGNGVTNIGGGGYSFLECGNLSALYFEGNAPTPQDSSVFLGDGSATAYYLPGSSGWGTSFDGIPTVEMSTLVFTANPTTGSAPLAVNFTSPGSDSTGNPLVCWNWAFGDGTGGGAQNPTHTYTNAGTYYPVLVATNSAGLAISAVSPSSITVSQPSPFTWTINNGTVTITGYTGAGGMVSIPTTITGVAVTGIGTRAFYDCTSLTGITIPNGVTSIGTSAFNGCINLAGVTIPNSVTNIADDAFAECGQLTNLTIPGSVTSIGAGAFGYCTSLTQVAIPDSVVSLGGSAFSDCFGLTNVTIGNGVTGIGGSAFNVCTNLTAVTIGNSVTNIGDDAFGFCHALTSIAIPNSVISIGQLAFIKCNALTNATIGNGVASIGDSAFAVCTNLTSITIPSSVTNIGNGVFVLCSRLSRAIFEGNAPKTFLSSVFSGTGSGFAIYYSALASGWSTPTWNGYPAYPYSTIGFTANPTSGSAPLTVNFAAPGTDGIGNPLVGWSWSFGDGAGSSAQNPSHIYMAAGAFSPVLVATNNAGQTIVGVGPSAITVFPNGTPPLVAGNAQYSRASGVKLLISVGDLLTNVTGGPATLVGVGTDGHNLRSTNGATLFTNAAFILYTNSVTPNASDSFLYTVQNTLGQTASGTVSIMVNSTNVTGQTASVRPTGGIVTLNFYGTPGNCYKTQRSTNLVNWVCIGTNYAPNEGAFQVIDSFQDLGGTPPSSAYYRLCGSP